MKAGNEKLKTLGQFKNKHYGQPSSRKRDALETGYQNFKIGALKQEAQTHITPSIALHTKH